jgi:anti-anti-sigma factor
VELLTDAGCRQESPEVADEVLKVMGTAELIAAHGERFAKQVRASLNGHTSVEIDLSQTTSIDCAGLGALIAIRNQTRLRNGVVRLLNPTTAVQQLLDLMRAGQIFEIANTAICQRPL